jgi:two-component system, chemotaxis family, sensor histidine kinase and response regulator WspE
MSPDDDLTHLSLPELFLREAGTQTGVLSEALLALEREPTDPAQLEACMRAAHSLKGAARIVGLQAGVDVAHAMEDCFVSAQRGQLVLGGQHIDELLRGVDLLLRVGDDAGVPKAEVDGFVEAMVAGKFGAPGEPGPSTTIASATGVHAPAHVVAERRLQVVSDAVDGRPPQSSQRSPGTREAKDADRQLRVTAGHLNRLLSLSGESLLEARWLKLFAESMLRMKRLQRDASRSLDVLHGALTDIELDERSHAALNDVRRLTAECHRMLGDRLAELEIFDRRYTNLSQQLYDEALACRMRPFADGTAGYARMVRDLGRSLGKQVRLEIVGATTQVDRDILELLDAPLGHVLRNAVDHGIESPAVRVARGKPAQGVITLEARHSAGVLQVSIADDGAGIDLDAVRAAVVRRKLATAATSERLSDAELVEFLMLPGFSMREQLTDVSGRGVGLDVVQSMLKQVRGSIRITHGAGQGTRFVLHLPLTLSVIRSLLVELGGEPYGFPLAAVTRTLQLRKDQIELLEGHQHFSFEGLQIGLITARQIFGASDDQPAGDAVPVVVIGNEHGVYGLVVDRFLGERMLVVQPLDTRLGKIRDVSAGALMENGDPVLLVDVEDLIRSIEKLVSGGHLDKVRRGSEDRSAVKKKRVLVVDDSLTVRELERKLLTNRGYEVAIAVDGMDGWNALRSDPFDLLVTDVDMPRMDGIELVTLVKHDPALRALPVLIVSYKDREEDRQRGLDAGADYYLAKGSFDDEALLDAVRDLIGEAHA